MWEGRLLHFRRTALWVWTNLTQPGDYYHSQYIIPQTPPNPTNKETNKQMLLVAEKNLIKWYCWRHHILWSQDIWKASWNSPGSWLTLCWLTILVPKMLGRLLYADKPSTVLSSYETCGLQQWYSVMGRWPTVVWLSLRIALKEEIHAWCCK